METSNVVPGRKPGKIILIIGAMMSGKSSEGFHILETVGYAVRGLYVNSSFDIRSETPFSTHNTTLDISALRNLNADMVKVGSLAEISDEQASKYEVVVLDESQFYPDLPEVVTRWVENLGIDVYVLGLSGDYKRKNFGRIHELLALADDVKMLRDTLCEVCALKKIRTPALFTHRREDLTKEQVEVGSSNYMPVCRGCYVELN